MSFSLFGTDGIRATVGESPFTTTQLLTLAHAIARWACNTYGSSPRILIAHDTRISCHFVKATLKAGLFLHPITLIDAEVLPTPALCKIMQQDSSFDCGIMISASHNPYHDNGIKIITKHGIKLDAVDADIITRFFHTPTTQTYHSFGTQIQEDALQKRYQDLMLSYFPSNFLHNKKIILDCAHGATYAIASTLFQACGAQTIIINNTPNGTNINNHCGSVYPQQLQQAVKEHNADLGFAFDGDGDRVIAVNIKGEVCTGDDMLAFLLDHPAYKQQINVVGTVMTNYAFEQFLQTYNTRLLRVAVGDKAVSEKLIQENGLIGGEPSGHIILRDYLDTGDGIFTALRVAHTAMLTNNWTIKKYQEYPQILLNVRVAHRHNLKEDPYASIINKYQKQLQNGRLIVRYSGTEPVLRIMVESAQKAIAETLAHELSHVLQKELARAPHSASKKEVFALP
jgi:phosphoglucosamine mutase